MYCTTPLCVRLLPYLLVDTGLVLLSAHLYLGIAKRKLTKLSVTSSLSAVDLGQAVGHPMHDLLGLPVRSVRLSDPRSVIQDRVRRHVRSILLECLRNEEQHNRMFGSISDPSLVL